MELQVGFYGDEKSSSNSQSYQFTPHNSEKCSGSNNVGNKGETSKYEENGGEDTGGEGDRLERISNKIREASGIDFRVSVDDTISRAAGGMQAVVINLHDVRVTNSVLRNLTDDELAWVLAHEAGHVARNHDGSDQAKMRTEIIQRRSESLTQINRDMKEKGHGIAYRTALSTIGVAAGAAEQVLRRQAVSRGHEIEADDFANEIASRAGFDPIAGAEALKKIDGGLRKSGFVDGLLSTHPDSKDRAERIKGKK